MTSYLLTIFACDSNVNIMVQIKVSEELADTLKWKSENIESEKDYLLDAMCETIYHICSTRDGRHDTLTMMEFWPLCQFADYKRLLDELSKSLEIIK